MPPSIKTVPHHIAIIMDGNGRWAKARGLPRIKGHEAGAEAVRECVEGCGELKVEYLKLFQQTHQSEDFASGTLPVLSRERVKCEVFDFQFTAAFHALANRFGACFVALDARQTARLGPTAVAIHNDRNVMWNGFYARGHATE